MPYILAYLLILLDISILPSILEPFVVWSLGYLIIISNLYKKDPLDPRIWLFLGVGILLINGFSGILYVPSNINEQRIIIYVMLTIFSFHLGFGKLENANYAILLRRRLRNVFNSYSSYSNKIHVLLGLLGIIGSLMICFEMFVLLGVSMDDGGERRRQFKELFPLMVLTPIGTILLGGSFPSIFSVFCGGSKINILLGLVNILALALSSMAIAGKQGILFVTLILAYIYFFHKCYRIKIKIPVYVKYCIFAFIYLFVLYISFLTIGRQNVTHEGQLLENGTFSKEFAYMAQKNLPSSIQNNFAEFFGYYGNQFPYVAERWSIENFEEKYGYFRLPRVLGAFTFVERQVIKIFPFYNVIYPDDRVATIKNQSKGYFGNANWGTIAFLNIKYFGILGGLIAFFFVGKISRKFYNHFFRSPNYITFQLNYINCAGMFYFTMFYFTQETGPFFYLVILLIFELYFQKQNISFYKKNPHGKYSYRHSRI